MDETVLVAYGLLKGNDRRLVDAIIMSLYGKDVETAESQMHELKQMDEIAFLTGRVISLEADYTTDDARRSAMVE